MSLKSGATKAQRFRCCYEIYANRPMNPQFLPRHLELGQYAKYSWWNFWNKSSLFESQELTCDWRWLRGWANVEKAKELAQSISSSVHLILFVFQCNMLIAVFCVVLRLNFSIVSLKCQFCLHVHACVIIFLFVLLSANKFLMELLWKLFLILRLFLP